MTQAFVVHIIYSVEVYMLDGILPVFKPEGISSYDLIRRIKSILGKQAKYEKIGHGGTLDPMATGVILILFGEATKCFQFLLDNGKEYIAWIKFGAFTTTDDKTGEVIERSSKVVCREDVEKVLFKFSGKILQTPPYFSAVKIDGVRSYEIAREGKGIELKPREVEIYKIELLDFDNEKNLAKFYIICSSGTYIRSIARDLGKELKTGGYLEALVRTKDGGIKLEDCYKIEEIESSRLEKLLLPVKPFISYPSIEWGGSEDFVKNGKKLYVSMLGKDFLNDGKYTLTKGDKLLAIIEKNGKEIRYLRVFL